MTERRQDKRFAAVELIVVLIKGERERRVAARDIGAGGICFVDRHPLKIGAKCRVRLALDFGQDRFSEPLELPIRAVWSTRLKGRFQIGASFDQLDEQQQLDLQTLLHLCEREVSQDDIRFRTGDHGAVG